MRVASKARIFTLDLRQLLRDLRKLALRVATHEDLRIETDQVADLGLKTCKALQPVGLVMLQNPTADSGYSVRGFLPAVELPERDRDSFAEHGVPTGSLELFIPSLLTNVSK